MTLPSKSDHTIDDDVNGNKSVEVWKSLALEERVRRGEVPVQEKFICKRVKRLTETETVATAEEEERGGEKT